MRRYATIIGRTGIGRVMADVWIVVRSDEVAEAELLDRGFVSIPEQLSDDEIRARYGVDTIYTLVDGDVVN